MYLAGECSDASRRLVEDYLRHHPERAAAADEPAFPAVSPPADLELRMLERARRLRERRNSLLGAALACSYAVFLFRFKGPDIVFLAYRDAPLLAWLLLSAGLFLWLWFLQSSSELANTGLLGAPRSPAAKATWALGGAAAFIPYGFAASHQTGWELTANLAAIGGFTGIAVGQALGRVKS